MKLTFDLARSERNCHCREIGFAQVERFGWPKALSGVSRVRNAGTATRFFAVGEVDEIVHTVIFTFEGDGVRVISLRRSNQRERRRWHASRIPT